MAKLLFAIFLLCLLLAFCIVCIIGSHLSIHFKINNLMKTSQDFKALLERQNTALANVVDDIRRIKEKLQGGGLTEAEEEQLYTDWEASIQAIEALAASTPEDDETPGDGETEPPVDGE